MSPDSNKLRHLQRSHVIRQGFSCRTEATGVTLHADASVERNGEHHPFEREQLNRRRERHGIAVSGFSGT